MKTTVGNVCFVTDQKNKKILLLKRKNEPMQGMYTGVGGKTDFHEDINASCVREVFEETGLKVDSVKLCGVVKTILDGKGSSWILFVYTADQFSGELAECNEGELSWIDFDQVYKHDLIGFIREILPQVLESKSPVEATIVHDMRGRVLKKLSCLE